MNKGKFRQIWRKSFGGLDRAYYFRHLFFGAIICAIFVAMIKNTYSAQNSFIIIFIAINTLLYPYSRFVYESVINFILGENVFFVNAILLLFVKFMMMFLCWGFAIFIAPLGLIYLLYYHTKNGTFDEI